MDEFSNISKDKLELLGEKVTKLTKQYPLGLPDLSKIDLPAHLAAHVYTFYNAYIDFKEGLNRFASEPNAQNLTIILDALANMNHCLDENVLEHMLG